MAISFRIIRGQIVCYINHKLLGSETLIHFFHRKSIYVYETRALTVRCLKLCSVCISSRLMCPRYRNKHLINFCVCNLKKRFYQQFYYCNSNMKSYLIGLQNYTLWFSYVIPFLIILPYKRRILNEMLLLIVVRRAASS